MICTGATAVCDCEEEVETDEGFDWQDATNQFVTNLVRYYYPGPVYYSGAAVTKFALLDMFKNLYSERDLVPRSNPFLSEKPWQLKSYYLSS